MLIAGVLLTLLLKKLPLLKKRMKNRKKSSSMTENKNSVQLTTGGLFFHCLLDNSIFHLMGVWCTF